ncbi:hypothetical protein [Enhygromyxa salina]|nr:hypothetical protein [Enhygromyxa salina]
MITSSRGDIRKSKVDIERARVLARVAGRNRQQRRRELGLTQQLEQLPSMTGVVAIAHTCSQPLGASLSTSDIAPIGGHHRGTRERAPAVIGLDQISMSPPPRERALERAARKPQRNTKLRERGWPQPLTRAGQSRLDTRNLIRGELRSVSDTSGATQQLVDNHNRMIRAHPRPTKYPHVLEFADQRPRVGEPGPRGW